jgi:hypothetical protein
MGGFLAVAILSSAAFAQSASLSGDKSVRDQGARSASRLESAIVGSPGLPPLPSGRSTVIGGAIRGVDRIRDQFTVNVFGGRTLKILFDARTQVYRDGFRTALSDLRPGAHVSVETMLDGTDVFARSIHLLSAVPEGECQGQVLNFDPGDGELTMRDVLSHEPVKVRVPPGTTIVRQGQAASVSSDRESAGLGKGALISVKFQPDNKGRGVASQIVILAAPGMAFVFVGSVAFLDLHSGELVLVDPRDEKRYEVFFDPDRFPMSSELHEGADVTVTANFDGERYVANAINISAASGK